MANNLESPQSSERHPQLVEVTCRSSGNTWHFASRVTAGFAMSYIRTQLEGHNPIVLHIEAAKEGRERIIFGPDSLLSNYGDGWKLYACVESAGLTWGPGVEFLEVICRSTGKARRFARGVKAGFAVSMMNKKLKAGDGLALYIEAVKEGEEPVVFGPDSLLIDYGDGWKLFTAVLSTGLTKDPNVQGPVSHPQGSGGKKPEVSYKYIGKIIMALMLIFMLGALLTLALESLPSVVSSLS